MEPKKQNSRKLQALKTKRKIFESAEKLIRIHGLDNLSVDAIVEEAGVSKGAFYVHYESKAALLAEYANNLDFNYEKFFTSLPADQKPSDLLVLLTEKITDVMINDIGHDLLRIIYEALLNKNSDTAIAISYNRKVYQLYRQVVGEGVRRGEFRTSLDVDSVANHFVMSLRGLTYEWCIRFPDFDFKKEALTHINILLTGIKNSPPDGQNR